MGEQNRVADEEELLMREVDEDVRRDKFDKAWRKYRVYVIGSAVSIVLVVAANTFWTAHVKSERDKASDAYTAILLDAEAEGADASAIWNDRRDKLKEGYIELSQLQEAAALIKADKIDEAIVVYDALSGNNGANKRLRDLAQLLAGRIEYGQGKYAEARGRLATLSNDENTWNMSAQETLAHIDIAEGNITEALIKLTLLAGNPAAPRELQQRAEDLRQLLEPQIEAASHEDNTDIKVDITNAEDGDEPEETEE